MIFIIEKGMPGKYLNSPVSWRRVGMVRAVGWGAAMTKARRIVGSPEIPVRVIAAEQEAQP